MHPNDGRVVSNFIVQALKGEPITLYGTGSQSRSSCAKAPGKGAFVGEAMTKAEGGLCDK